MIPTSALSIFAFSAGFSVPKCTPTLRATFSTVVCTSIASFRKRYVPSQFAPLQPNGYPYER